MEVIIFTVICKTKSLIRLDCVPPYISHFLQLFNWVWIVTTLDILANSWKSGRVFGPFACINPKTVSRRPVSNLLDSKRCCTFLQKHKLAVLYIGYKCKIYTPRKLGNSAVFYVKIAYQTYCDPNRGFFLKISMRKM